jgi:hypothetical protein
MVNEKEKEKSASELQIEEKLERMRAMKQLVIELTLKQIREEILKNRDLETIIKNVSEKGIHTSKFINSYLKEPQHGTKTQVDISTAKKYFEHYSECLEPDFITFNPKDSEKVHTHFHLTIDTIKALANSELLGKPQLDVKFSGKPDKPKKR